MTWGVGSDQCISDGQSCVSIGSEKEEGCCYYPRGAPSLMRCYYYTQFIGKKTKMQHQCWTAGSLNVDAIARGGVGLLLHFSGTLPSSLLSDFVEILFCKVKEPGPLSLTTGLVARIWCFHHCNLALITGWESKPCSKPLQATQDQLEEKQFTPIFQRCKSLIFRVLMFWSICGFEGSVREMAFNSVQFSSVLSLSRV